MAGRSELARADSKSMAGRCWAPWLPRFGSGSFDLAALHAPGRPGWVDLGALCAPGRSAGSIWLLEKRGPVQQNIDFAAQGQCFVNVALVASIWVFCLVLGVLAGSIWLPCSRLGALAGSPAWLNLAAQGALAHIGCFDLLANECPNDCQKNIAQPIDAACRDCPGTFKLTSAPKLKSSIYIYPFEYSLRGAKHRAKIESKSS